MREVVVGVLLTALVSIAGFMAYSIQELNQNVAVVISRLTYHEKELESHEAEIRELKAGLTENKKGGSRGSRTNY